MHLLMKSKKYNMKIALISLPKNEFRYPPIGLLRIATYIKRKTKDVEVRLIDNAFEDIYEKIDNFNPDIIGLTTFTSYYQDSIDFSSIIKSKYPGIKIIAGGPHITTLPESLDKNFDFGIIGEGERIFLNLINALLKNKSVENIKGIVYYKNGRLVVNKRDNAGYSGDLDELHAIDYNFLNKKYWNKKFAPEIYDFKVSTGIITSIGCPFNCIFCSCKSCWGNIRYRNIENVVKEIKELYYNFGVRHIDIYDDLFAVNKKRLNEFCNKLKQENLQNKITFSCQARADILDEEMCALLRKLNVKTLVFGFESGSDKVLKYVKNNNLCSVEKNKNAIILCKKYGLNVMGCLMMGIPTEKIEDMKKTTEFIDFARKNNALKLWTQILVPLPATEIWEIAKSRGKIKDNMANWKGIHIHNKENPILLDPDIQIKEFLVNYNLAKKKCRPFVYRLFFKTIYNDPANIFHFVLEGKYYIQRFFLFVKQ